MILHGTTLYQVRLPLTTPYKVAYRVYNDFDPIFVRLRDTNGNEGWGEGHISPGYSHETVENDGISAARRQGGCPAWKRKPRANTCCR